MKQSQNQQKVIQPAPPEQLETTKTVQPSPIEETLEKVSQALKALPRKHRCRVCRMPNCTHYEREYLDTKEPFDQNLLEATNEEATNDEDIP